MQKLSRFSKCYFMDNLKISVGCENSSFHFERMNHARMNQYFKLIEESMRKNLVDILQSVMPPLGGFTWNVPLRRYFGSF
jgi:hypothetical protein